MLTALKRWFDKALFWDHSCQVVLVLASIPGAIIWARGHGTATTGFAMGWNLGCAFYWQFYVSERKRTKIWMKRAMQSVGGDVDEKLLNVAKGLVEARFKAQHIDPDRN